MCIRRRAKREETGDPRHHTEEQRSFHLSHSRQRSRTVEEAAVNWLDRPGALVVSESKAEETKEREKQEAVEIENFSAVFALSFPFPPLLPFSLAIASAS